MGGYRIGPKCRPQIESIGARCPDPTWGDRGMKCKFGIVAVDGPDGGQSALHGSRSAVRRALKRYTCLIGLVVAQSLTYAASFDCGKASTWVEKAICASPRLSELDDELGTLYRHEWDRTPDAGGARDEVRSRQLDWLRDTRNVCSGEACIEVAYSQRITALREAKALYEEARDNAEQEDRHPPPGVGTSDTSATSATVNGPAEGQVTSVEQPAPPPAASSVVVSAPSSASGVKDEKSSSKAGGETEWLPALLAGAAILQVPFVFLIVYRRTRKSKGIARGLAYGSATSATAFLVLAVAGYSLESEEEKMRLRAARQEKERREVAAAKAVPLPSVKREASAQGTGPTPSVAPQTMPFTATRAAGTPVSMSTAVSQFTPGQEIKASGLSAAEYKRVCERTKSATDRAIRMLSMSVSQPASELLSGGSVNRIQVIWAKPNNGREGCFLLVDASGIVRGTSTRAEAQGRVDSFIANDRGETLVHAAHNF